MTVDPGQERPMYNTENPQFTWDLAIAYSRAYVTTRQRAYEATGNLISLDTLLIATAAAEGRLLRDLRDICTDYGVPFDPVKAASGIHPGA